MKALNAVVSIQNSSASGECGSNAWCSECLFGSLSSRGGQGCQEIDHTHLEMDSGETLFRRQDSFRSVFVICAGAVKTQRVMPDGDLLVTGVWLPGDIVGLDGLGGNQHEFDAVATKPSRVVRLSVGQLLKACTQDTAINAWFTQRLGHLLRRKVTDQAWAKGLQSNERILRFFLDLHERMYQGDSDTLIEGELPMPKQDIARYLNMAPETLSRNLSSLRRKRLLVITKTHFAVPDVAQARLVTQL